MEEKKQKQVQLTLLKVLEEEEQSGPIRIFSTDFFKLRTTQDAIDALNEKCEDENSNGTPKYDEDEQLAMKIGFVQDRMNPVKPQSRKQMPRNMSAEEYYLSKRSLLKQIFDEDLE